MGRFNRDASTNLVYIASDCIFCITAFLLAGFFSGIGSIFFQGKYFMICVIFLILFILENKEAGLYNVTTFFYADRMIRRVSSSFMVSASVISILLFYIGKATIDHQFYVMCLLLSYFFLLGNSFLVRGCFMKYFAHAPRTLLVGNPECFHRFERFMKKSNVEMKRIGYICIDEADYNKDEYIGKLSDLEKILHFYGIDQLYVMQRKKHQTEIQPYLNMCVEMGVTVRIIMNPFQADSVQNYVSSMGTYPVLTYHTVSLNVTERFLKRAIDILGSLVGILITCPVMLLTAIAIRWDSPGKVIFKQERVGLNGRHFFMYKFRSMCADAEEKKMELMEQNEMNSQCMFKMQDDPRITKVGKFIRKTSIDELPQFFNVLMGEMSLVGTRPPTLDEVKLYERSHWRRMSIKPGITGMWQVSGRSSVTNFDEIVELDTKYIDQWNVLLDIEILLKTIIQVVCRKGAF